jgi:hypothetical protein
MRLIVLPRPENRLAIGQGDAHAFPDRSRERENIGQEGFDALVHRAFRPGSLRASPCVFRRRSGSRVQAGKDYQRLLPGCQGSSDAGQEVGQFGSNAVQGRREAARALAPRKPVSVTYRTGLGIPIADFPIICLHEQFDTDLLSVWVPHAGR